MPFLIALERREILAAPWVRALGPCALSAVGALTAFALGAPIVALLLVHLVALPLVLAPARFGQVLALQFLVVPISVVIFTVIGIALLPLLHSETLVGLLAGAFYALEPGVAALVVTHRDATS